MMSYRSIVEVDYVLSFRKTTTTEFVFVFFNKEVRVQPLFNASMARTSLL